jgi:hypothetical protein
MRKRSSDSIRKNEFLTQNLTKLTKSAFKHISERNFSEKKFKSKTDTPRVSDAEIPILLESLFILVELDPATFVLSKNGRKLPDKVIWAVATIEAAANIVAITIFFIFFSFK